MIVQKRVDGGPSNITPGSFKIKVGPSTLNPIATVVPSTNVSPNPINHSTSPFDGYIRGTAITINNPGRYQITETSPNNNYRTAFSGGCSSDGTGTIAAGQRQTSIITNTFTRSAPRGVTLNMQ
jgi:hypothetical protein